MVSIRHARSEEPAADFYVSTEGSDAWSGTLAVPNQQQSDRPFATLERARDAVRESGQNRSGDVTVLVRGGLYRLAKTVVFALQDSGHGESTVTYAAYPSETPVFSSGREIRDWKTLTTAPAGLRKEAFGKVQVASVSRSFRALFDAEGLLPRARSKGFIPREDGSRTELHFPAGRLKNWPNITDVEILVRPHHAWVLNILPMESVDERRQIARTSIAATYAMNPLHFLKQTESCWVENALEELDEPGEWVLNTQAGKLYFWPRNDSPVLAPQLTELIRVEGDVDKEGPTDKPVRNLRFRMAAGVSWYGPCDFENIDLSNHDDRADFRDRFEARIMGSDSGTQDKSTRYREVSPINYLSKGSPPLLMIPGNKDTTIPVKHAYYMKKRADGVGAPFEIMIIKNSGHNWRRVDADIEPSRESIIERTIQFFVDQLSVS